MSVSRPKFRTKCWPVVKPIQHQLAPATYPDRFPELVGSLDETVSLFASYKKLMKNIHLTTIDAITFDAVGTLIVPTPSVGEIYAEELSKMGHNIPPKIIEERFSLSFRAFKKDYPQRLLNRESWREIVSVILKGLTPEEDIDNLFAILWNTFTRTERWRLLPGVLSTLQHLSQKELRLFVLSNNDERLHAILHGLGIARYFEKIFVSAELGAEKPSTIIFKRVEDSIRVQAKKILHVGDSLSEDIQGALQSGWNAALISSVPDDCQMAYPIEKANSIEELFSRI